VSNVHARASRLRLIVIGGNVITSPVRSEETSMDVRRLARFRQKAYRLVGAMLLYPEEPVIEAASWAARQLRFRNRWAAKLAFYGPYEQFLRRTESLVAARTGELQEVYLALFGNSAARQMIPLCESAYLDPAYTASGWILGDLEREYASAGLSAINGQSPDHAAVELEFISLLCDREIEAWNTRNLPGVLKAVRRQRRFLEQHPCQWFPYLARAVARRDEFGFYGYVAEAARAIAVHDADFLRTLAERLGAEARDAHIEGGTP
jgi:TorA maturation chaperone TorD